MEFKFTRMKSFRLSDEQAEILQRLAKRADVSMSAALRAMINTADPAIAELAASAERFLIAKSLDEAENEIAKIAEVAGDDAGAAIAARLMLEQHRPDPAAAATVELAKMASEGDTLAAVALADRGLLKMPGRDLQTFFLLKREHPELSHLSDHEIAKRWLNRQ